MKATAAMVWIGVVCVGVRGGGLPAYEFVDYQPGVGSGPQWGILAALNDAGLIVGTSSDDAVVYVGSVQFGTPGRANTLPFRGLASDVNNAGRFVGSAFTDDDGPLPFLADSSGGYSMIQLPAPFTRAGVMAISDNDWIGGIAFEADYTRRPWLIDPAGTQIVLSDAVPIDDQPWEGSVNDVNSNGYAVGEIGPAFKYTKAFAWDPKQGLRVLDDVFDSPKSIARPWAVNEAGIAVGLVADGPVSRAVYWTPDGTAHVIPTESISATASDINDHGQIVGREGINYPRVFIWDEEQGTRYLEDLVPGYRFDYVHDINNNGEMLVWYHEVNSDDFRMGLLRPVPAPSTLLLIGLFYSKRRRQSER